MRFECSRCGCFELQKAKRKLRGDPREADLILEVSDLSILSDSEDDGPGQLVLQELYISVMPLAWSPKNKCQGSGNA